MKTYSQLAVSGFLMLIAQPAFSYLDPGTGSMLLQVLLGGVAAVVVGVKFYWHKICSLFGFGPKPEAEEEQGESDV